MTEINKAFEMPKMPKLPSPASMGSKMGGGAQKMGAKIGTMKPVTPKLGGAQQKIGAGMKQAGAAMSAKPTATGVGGLAAGSAFAAGGIHSVFGPKKDKNLVKNHSLSAFGVNHG